MTKGTFSEARMAAAGVRVDRWALSCCTIPPTMQPINGEPLGNIVKNATDGESPETSLRDVRRRALDALTGLQRDAARRGLDRLTMDDIEREVQAFRRDKKAIEDRA